MGKVATVEKAVKKSLEQVTAGDWGLLTCIASINCQFCQLYSGDEHQETRRKYRNLFVSGYPRDLIPKMLDVEGTLDPDELRKHAWRQNWHKKKQEAPDFQFDEKVLNELIFRRMMKAWDVISESTADKMMDMAMKMAGVGQKVEVSGNVNITWEKIAAKANATQDEAIIELDDNEFSEVEVPQLEGPIAETD